MLPGEYVFSRVGIKKIRTWLGDFYKYLCGNSLTENDLIGGESRTSVAQQCVPAGSGSTSLWERGIKYSVEKVIVQATV